MCAKNSVIVHFSAPQEEGFFGGMDYGTGLYGKRNVFVEKISLPQALQIFVDRKMGTGYNDRRLLKPVGYHRYPTALDAFCRFAGAFSRGTPISSGNGRGERSASIGLEKRAKKGGKYPTVATPPLWISDSGIGESNIQV